MMENKRYRYTPEQIDKLEDDEIFVFGSNPWGVHNSGAAHYALQMCGAIMGQGVGLQGRSYAIPTTYNDIAEIKPYVDEFISFARENNSLVFLVTRIGCGAAGFKVEQIAPLFRDALGLDNIILPEPFVLIMSNKTPTP